MAEPKVHRVTVNFSEGAYRTLDELARKQGRTKAEVLRNAIALERWVHEVREDGGRLLVERADGSLREVIPR